MVTALAYLLVFVWIGIALLLEYRLYVIKRNNPTRYYRKIGKRGSAGRIELRVVRWLWPLMLLVVIGFLCLVWVSNKLSNLFNKDTL